MTDMDVAAHHRAIVLGILTDVAPRPCRVFAFGSRVQGRARRFSDLDLDLDLAVDAGRALTLREEALLADAFDESDLPWRVDIVDLASCSPAFRRVVEAQAMPFLALSARPA